jgi:4-amino-4-deoxy-L-arabinose transferase-like glycosyltransferase
VAGVVAPAAERRPAPSRGYGAALGAIVLAALALRVFAARQKILWFDEFLAGNLVRHPWRELLAAVRAEAHPPLYFALLKAWTGLFGDGPLGMRSLSVAAGTAAVVVLADAVRRARGESAALAAAVLVAFSTVQLDQASEAKPYAVLAFFTALLIRAVIRDREDPSGGSLAASMAAGAALASTHFYGGVAAGAIALSAAVWAVGRRERRRAALLLGGVVAVSAVWLAAAWKMPAGAADYIREMWKGVPAWAPLAASTRVALPGWRKPYPSMSGSILPGLETREIFAAAVVAVILIAAGVSRRRTVRPAPPERAKRRFLAFAALGLWPGFLALESVLAALDRPIALVGRSEVVAELGLAILVGFAVARWGRPAAVPIAALALLGLWTTVPPWRPRNGPVALRWEDVIVRRLRAVVPPGARVDVVTLGLGRPPFDYYAAGDPRLRFISFPESQNAHPGWAAHSIAASEASRLAAEAQRLAAELDAELGRGVPVLLVDRGDPRNAYLLSVLRRDHELRPVPWGPGWLLSVTRPPVLAA